MATDREILVMRHGAEIHFIALDGARWVFKDRQTPRGRRIQRSLVGNRQVPTSEIVLIQERVVKIDRFMVSFEFCAFALRPA
ncbi:hypothetical protein [Corynebacterium sp. HMSC071B10]|uniref:hypothetical protein n=1 Tax=Corynebacterium sp. HMSC071B10 TaxID=1739494 RepID=UPI0008A63605|nr:hypothetical protein [Corynebacterium sp. HMSC071B10]OFP36432.1 hypothetical protein HMPREF2990_01125 [Corynebacterium sp. HMSC071B10]